MRFMINFVVWFPFWHIHFFEWFNGNASGGDAWYLCRCGAEKRLSKSAMQGIGKGPGCLLS